MAGRYQVFVDQEKSRAIDEELLQTYTLAQLMELAGLSVAQAAHAHATGTRGTCARALVLAGPGNNGGDALVAARHLALWGVSVEVFAPRVPERLEHLRGQAERAGAMFVGEFSGGTHDLVLDGVLGFGLSGPVREPWDRVLGSVGRVCPNAVIVSIDVPSGWPFAPSEETDTHTLLRPHAIVSVSAPKTCLHLIQTMDGYRPAHYLAGPFMSSTTLDRHGLSSNPRLPPGCLYVRCLYE